MARRGATVLGVDANPHYLAQARWAAETLGLSGACRFECHQVYELAHMKEQWDLVLFTGVFYHLRYPLLGLDIVAEKVRRYLVFQSVATGSVGTYPKPADFDFQSLDKVDDPSWPRMAFIEHTFCHDATNWWIPSRSAVVGMLRSTGLRIENTVDPDTIICVPDGTNGARGWNRNEFLAACGAASEAVPMSKSRSRWAWLTQLGIK